MFRLKFPSGAKLELGDCNRMFEGTLYIWDDDLEPLLEILKEELRDVAPNSRTEQNRDSNRGESGG